jgi:hypothetical protein
MCSENGTIESFYLNFLRNVLSKEGEMAFVEKANESEKETED